MNGLVTPNYGQMGTELLPHGNAAEMPYGTTPPVGQAGSIGLASMQGSTPPAFENVGYRPQAGRADRLAANIVGGGFDSLASGGYSKGATQRI